jgi:hypothetical protein
MQQNPLIVMIEPHMPTISAEFLMALARSEKRSQNGSDD